MYELADLKFTSDEDDEGEYEEEDEFDEWEASEDDDDDGSTSSDEENIISVEESDSLETASLNSRSTSSDEEDLRSDELSSSFDEDTSEHSISLEAGLSDAEESVSADGSAQASSNDGGSSYTSSQAAEESEDCASAGEESNEDSISSGQARGQPKFFTPALSQVNKLVLSTYLHSSWMCYQASWHHLSTSLCVVSTSPEVLSKGSAI